MKILLLEDGSSESYQRAVDEHFQRVKEENEEKIKKLIEHRKKMTDIYGDGQEPY